MALYSVTSGQAVQLLARGSHPGKEKGLQQLVENNLETIFGVRFIQSEFSTGNKHRGRIDTLGLDQDGAPAIIEYKLRSNENVINQGLFYLDWLMDHRGDFELAARNKLGDDIEINWTDPRLILLAGSFSRYDQYAVNRIGERIELWTYKLYENDLLAIDLLSSDDAVSTSDDAASSTKAALKSKRKAAKPRPHHDLTHHLDKMSDTTRPLFESLREQLVDLGDDVTERFMNQYVGYRRLKNFCEIVGLKSKLTVYIDGPIDDPNGVCDDVSDIGHWGTGNRRATVASDDDIATVFPLIEQAYSLQE